MHKSLSFPMLALLAWSLMACTTRHIHDQYLGSTEQRLLSRSIDTLINDLPANSMPNLVGKLVYLKTNFIQENAVAKYAHSRLAMELQQRFRAKIVDDNENADYVVNAFFTSLGTDTDTFGLSLPLLYLPADDSRSNVPLLAIDKYHGISEIYFFVEDTATGKLTKTALYKARTKSDKIATPFISFPLDQID